MDWRLGKSQGQFGRGGEEKNSCAFQNLHIFQRSYA
jgi:hypothetical protein